MDQDEWPCTNKWMCYIYIYILSPTCTPLALSLKLRRLFLDIFCHCKLLGFVDHMFNFYYIFCLKKRVDLQSQAIYNDKKDSKKSRRILEDSASGVQVGDTK